VLIIAQETGRCDETEVRRILTYEEFSFFMWVANRSFFITAAAERRMNDDIMK
jgi:hypothetical protein